MGPINCGRFVQKLPSGRRQAGTDGSGSRKSALVVSDLRRETGERQLNRVEQTILRKIIGLGSGSVAPVRHPDALTLVPLYTDVGTAVFLASASTILVQRARRQGYVCSALTPVVASVSSRARECLDLAGSDRWLATSGRILSALSTASAALLANRGPLPLLAQDRAQHFSEDSHCHRSRLWKEIRAQCRADSSLLADSLRGATREIGVEHFVVKPKVHSDPVDQFTLRQGYMRYVLGALGAGEIALLAHRRTRK